MNNLAKLLLLFIVLVGPVKAGEWNNWGKVEEVYTYPARNGVYFKLDNHVNPDTCSSSTYLMLSKDNLLFGETYSLLLSAFSAKKSVRIFVAGCDGNYPKIDMVLSK